MLTHESIWTAIDRLAHSLGYSTSGLAKQAGLDPTAFNRSKRIGPDGKPRWPSTESIARVLDSTGSTIADFMSLIDAGIHGPKAQPMIPVLSYTQAQEGANFNDKGLPTGDGWETIDFPHPSGEQPVTYAIEVVDDSMMPLFRVGDRLIVVPDAPLRRGDRVIVRLADGSLLVRELVRQTASKVELKFLTMDKADRSVTTKDISWIARIVWVSQ